MANLYIGMNRGQSEKDVVTGSSTGSKDVELRVDDTKSLRKSEILELVEFITNVLLTKSSQFQ